jgi:hypothetical protein
LEPNHKVQTDFRLQSFAGLGRDAMFKLSSTRLEEMKEKDGQGAEDFENPCLHHGFRLASEKGASQTTHIGTGDGIKCRTLIRETLRGKTSLVCGRFKRSGSRQQQQQQQQQLG